MKIQLIKILCLTGIIFISFFAAAQDATMPIFEDTSVSQRRIFTLEDVMDITQVDTSAKTNLLELSDYEIRGVENAKNPLAVGLQRSLSEPIIMTTLDKEVPNGFYRKTEQTLLADSLLLLTSSIKSQGANAMRVELKIDKPICNSIKIFVYTENGEIYTPYTANNFYNNILWSHVFFYEEIFIQVQIPLGKVEPNFSGVYIETIGHKHKQSYFNVDCYEDINCSIALEYPHIDQLSRSVVRIDVWDSKIWAIGSGALVNNSNHLYYQGQPIIQTVGHIINSQCAAHNATFIFDLKTTSCWSGEADTLQYNGATLLFGVHEVWEDYALVLLYDNIIGNNRVWLGWTTASVPNGSVLHNVGHPGIDNPQNMQRYTRAEKSFLYEDFLDALITTHGATNKGTSGSPWVNTNGQTVGADKGALYIEEYDVCDYNSYYASFSRFNYFYNEYMMVEWVFQGDLPTNIDVSTLALDFGSVNVGNSDEKEFIVYNGAPPSFNLGASLLITGPDKDYFSIIDGNPYDYPTDYYIPPNQQENIYIKFQPLSEGAKNATLRIYHNATNFNHALDIPLTGEGIFDDDPQIEIQSISLHKSSYIPGETAYLTVRLGDQIAGANVTYSISGGSTQELNDEGNGFYQASFSTPTNPGSYTLNIVADKEGYLPATGNTILLVYQSTEGWDANVVSLSANPSYFSGSATIYASGNIRNDSDPGNVYNSLFAKFELFNPQGDLIHDHSHTINQLSPGETVTISMSNFTITSDSPNGTYQLRLSVHPPLDSDYSNNIRTVNIIKGTQPDAEHYYFSDDHWNVELERLDEHVFMNNTYILRAADSNDARMDGPDANLVPIPYREHSEFDGYNVAIIYWVHVGNNFGVFHFGNRNPGLISYENDHVAGFPGQHVEFVGHILPGNSNQFQWRSKFVESSDGVEVEQWYDKSATVLFNDNQSVRRFFTIPENTTPGKRVFYFLTGYHESNHFIKSRLEISVLSPPPEITLLSAYSFAAGEEITISGNNFGSYEGQVIFNDLNGTVTSWSDTEITCIVPQGVQSGILTVMRGANLSNGVAYEALSNVILLIEPMELNFGEVVINVTKTLSYLIIGSNIYDDVTITAPNGFKVSTNDVSGFENQLILENIDGNLDKTIFVRFEPNLHVTYIDHIGNYTAGIEPVYVYLEGSAIPPPCPDIPTVMDSDGNVYQTALIGDQCWTRSNLSVAHYNNGDPILTDLSDSEWVDTNEGAYAIYPYTGLGAGGINSPEEMVDAYGKLYNWHAVNDPRGLCPEGWNVPSDYDWTHLIGFLASQGFPNEFNKPSGAGNALKSCRKIDSPLAECNTTEHPRWTLSEMHYGFDEFGFSALPGGYRLSSGVFLNNGYNGMFWTSSENLSTSAWYRGMSNNNSKLTRLTSNMTSGFSLRCVKYISHEPNTSMIQLNVNPENSGVVFGAGVFLVGDEVNITAVPNEGWQFVNWTGDTDFLDDPISRHTSVTIPLNDIMLTANFEAVDYTLTLVVNPPQGGSVSGSGEYNFGDEIHINAIANPDWTFVHWVDTDGDEISESESFLYYMPASNITLIAIFDDDVIYCPGLPTVMDADGNVYQTVLIGDQCWTRSNLRVTHYNNGDPIITGLTNSEWSDTEDGAYAIYPYTDWNAEGINSSEEMVDAYGKLYNWYAVDDERGLCPQGWKVPSDDDWTQLTDYISGGWWYGGHQLSSCRQVNSIWDQWFGYESCNTTEHPRWDELFCYPYISAWEENGQMFIEVWSWGYCVEFYFELELINATLHSIETWYETITFPLGEVTYFEDEIFEFALIIIEPVDDFGMMDGSLYFDFWITGDFYEESIWNYFYDDLKSHENNSKQAHSKSRLNNYNINGNTGHKDSSRFYYTDTPDEYFFSALPAGSIWHNSNFSWLGSWAFFWTSTPFSETQSLYRDIYLDYPGIMGGRGSNNNGYSIRCILYEDFEVGIPEQLYLTNETISDGETECFEALQTITVSDFTVESGGSATLIAGESIHLLPGTTVEYGGYLLARIAAHEDDYCGIPRAVEIAKEPVASKEEDVVSADFSYEVRENGFFKLYPNPTDGTFSLELTTVELEQSISVEVHSMLGSRLFIKELPPQRLHTLSLESQQPGMYIIRVMKGDKLGVERLIKR